MLMSPLVSIVIPTYNRARDLGRALTSVRAQTHAQWEALVVDNHSSDDTERVVGSFDDARMRLFRIHNDGVIAVSRNEGIRRARGDYVAFLDSDDWWASRKLELSLRYLERGADVVYHDLFAVKTIGQRFFLSTLRSRDLARPAFSDLLVHGNGLINSSVVVRTSVLRAVEGLSEDRNLIAAEDYDTWLRIARMGGIFRRVPRTLGYYWQGDRNLSNPTRLIENLATIEDRYADAIREAGAQRCVYWIAYARGRAHYLQASYELARENLKRIGWRRAPFAIWFRAQWMLLRIRLTHPGRI